MATYLLNFYEVMLQSFLVESREWAGSMTSNIYNRIITFYILYRFMVIAIKILERALRDDFGWKYLLWVFSGRRGIHCWICDESARKLSSSERGTVIDYLVLLSAGDSKRYNVNNPFVKLVAINTIITYFKLIIITIFITYIRRSISIIREEFGSLLSEQNFLGTTEQCNKILSFVSDEKLKEQINLQFTKYQSSIQRWEALTVVVENNHKRVKIYKYYLTFNHYFTKYLLLLY